MSVPIFVDLQGFLVGRHFVIKEFAALKDEFELPHYIFGSPYPWTLLSKSESHHAMWLIENRHGIHWEDGIPYWMARSLIIKVVMCTMTTDDDDDDIVVNVKDMRNENGCGICSWMKREKMSVLKISRRIRHRISK